MALLILFLKGLGVGLAVAAPVGPVGVLCVRRTLDHGPWVGLVSGLGAAGADACYGAVAGFGLTAVAGLLIDFQDHLRLLGGAFLIFMGGRLLVRGPLKDDATVAADQTHLARAFGSCFLLTLTNPATIIAFVAIFAGLGLIGEAADYVAATSLVAGVFVGSAMWWLALCGFVSLVRGRVTPSIMPWINRASGTIITAFGVGALASFLF